MTAAATSLQRASIRGGAWAQFLAFLRRPALPDRASGIRAEAWGVLGKLLALDVLVMILLIAAMALATRLGFTAPRSLLEHIKPGPVVLGFIAIGAPIAEELLFRSWQSGRPGHVGAWLIAVAAVGLAVVTLAQGGSTPRAFGALAILVIGLVLAGWWLWSRRGRPAMRWFQRHYAWFYYGAAGLFAAAHLTNFAGGTSLAMLPLTLPQFSIGLMLGYVRVRFGLWASVLLHAAHNSLFVALLLAGA